MQVHSIDPPHPFILRSIELMAEKVAPALGWVRDDTRRRASPRRLREGQGMECRRHRYPGRHRARLASRHGAAHAPAGGARACAEELRLAVHAGRVRRLRPARALRGRGVRRRPAWPGRDQGLLCREAPQLGRDRRHAGGDRRGDRGGQDQGPVWRLPEGPAQQGGHGGPVHRVADDASARRWGRGSRRRSSTCTCWSSIRAMPTRARCSRCSMPAGRRPRS